MEKLALEKKTRNIWVAVAILYLITVVLCSCKKDTGSGDAVFYTKDPNGWVLILDGKEYGNITYSNYTPNCYSAGFQVLSLKEGEHTVDARSLSGQAWGYPRKITITADGCKPVRLP